MKENNIQTALSKVHTLHGVFELKLCKSKSIRFDSVKPHQVAALLEANENGLYHKISDFPMFAGSKTRFNKPKPFDFIYLKHTPSYVVICFYIPSKRKTCYYIAIKDWIMADFETSKKSITEEECERIASHVKKLWYTT